MKPNYYFESILISWNNYFKFISWNVDFKEMIKHFEMQKMDDKTFGFFGWRKKWYDKSLEFLSFSKHDTLLTCDNVGYVTTC